MTNVPLIFPLKDLGKDAFNPSYYGNDFGVGLHPVHIHHSGLQNAHCHLQHHEPSAGSVAVPLVFLGHVGNEAVQHQLNRRSDCQQRGGAFPSVGKDGFQVCMDVTQFKPNELKVKVVDNFVIVEGKHEERADAYGFISRQFVRRYALPEKFNGDNVVSMLSSDGVLTISVPNVQEKPNERIIQIQQVGPAHLNVKQNAQEHVGDGAAAKGGKGNK